MSARKRAILPLGPSLTWHLSGEARSAGDVCLEMAREALCVAYRPASNKYGALVLRRVFVGIGLLADDKNIIIDN